MTYGPPKIKYLVPNVLQNAKNSAIFAKYFFPLRKCFFANFEGTVSCGNKYDRGILNFRPLM